MYKKFLWLVWITCSCSCGWSPILIESLDKKIENIAVTKNKQQPLFRIFVVQGIDRYNVVQDALMKDVLGGSGPFVFQDYTIAETTDDLTGGVYISPCENKDLGWKCHVVIDKAKRDVIFKQRIIDWCHAVVKVAIVKNISSVVLAYPYEFKENPKIWIDAVKNVRSILAEYKINAAIVIPDKSIFKSDWSHYNKGSYKNALCDLGCKFYKKYSLKTVLNGADDFVWKKFAEHVSSISHEQLISDIDDDDVYAQVEKKLFFCKYIRKNFIERSGLILDYIKNIVGTKENEKVFFSRIKHTNDQEDVLQYLKVCKVLPDSIMQKYKDVLQVLLLRSRKKKWHDVESVLVENRKFWGLQMPEEKDVFNKNASIQFFAFPALLTGCVSFFSSHCDSKNKNLLKSTCVGSCAGLCSYGMQKIFPAYSLKKYKKGKRDVYKCSYSLVNRFTQCTAGVAGGLLTAYMIEKMSAKNSA